MFASNLEAALAYAASGWRVFPLKIRDKVPAIDAWDEHATTDETTIRRWWARCPDYNIGIACGADSNLFVVDLDSAAAVDAFQARVAANGGLGGNPLVVRTTKGLHLYFAHAPGLRNTGGRLDHVDTRGEGGYVVAPPSIHPSGASYEWAHYTDDDLPVPPPWLIDLFWSRPAPKQLEHDLPERWHEVTRDDLAEHRDRLQNRTDDAGKKYAYAAQAIIDGRSWAPISQRYTVIFGYLGSLKSFVAEKYGAEIDTRPEALAVFEPSMAAARAEKAGTVADVEWLAGKIAESSGRAFQADLQAEREAEPTLGLETLFPTPPPDPERAEIVFTLKDFVMVRQAIAALSSDRALFHRARRLVTIDVDDSAPDAGAQVFELKEPTIAEKLSERAVFVTLSEGDGDKKPVPTPPKVVSQVAARGKWPAVRALSGLLHAPTLRPDGSLLAEPGYDAGSKLYLTRSVPVDVPDAPTHADALRSRDTLLELVCDFPFTSDADRAVWLALVLTRACRLAVSGPTPVFAFDAPTRGTGKSMLAELACAIVLGKRQRTTSWPRNNSDDEVAKMLLAAALQGQDCLFFDNVKAPLGGGPLEMAITSAGINGRILGSTEMAEAPFAVTWIATGNNLRVTDDMTRRTIWCRLDPNCPDPENRTGFRFPAILEHVCARHADYLSAVLTILRAYIVAGRPSRARRLGSFEAWAETVAGAVCWVGLPDPSGTQARQRAESPDDEATARAALVTTILKEQAKKPPGEGVYVRDLAAPDTYRDIAEIVESCVVGRGHSGALTVQQLGELLKKTRGRVVEVEGAAYKLSGRTDRKGSIVWRVEAVAPAAQAA